MPWRGRRENHQLRSKMMLHRERGTKASVSLSVLARTAQVLLRRSQCAGRFSDRLGRWLAELPDEPAAVTMTVTMTVTVTGRPLTELNDSVSEAALTVTAARLIRLCLCSSGYQ